MLTLTSKAKKEYKDYMVWEYYPLRLYTNYVTCVKAKKILDLGSGFALYWTYGQPWIEYPWWLEKR
jgi:hypothetical protein